MKALRPWRRVAAAAPFGSLHAAVLALALLHAPSLVTAQASTPSATISGVVLSTAGTPVEAATVSVAGTAIGALTNRAGRFLLLGVPAGSHQLEVRMVGFRPLDRGVDLEGGDARVERITLVEEPFLLDGIVVTGTGAATEKRRIANTVGVIDAGRLANAPVASFSELLQAREPSLTALTSDGAVGSGTRIRIRGSNSVTMSNEPLVYVDGLRVDNSGDMGGNGRGGDVGSPLDDVNWEAVERVEVLKGPAAATLYGSEASSGVIQIFTKAGRPGPARLTARAELGRSTYPDVIPPVAGFASGDARAAELSEHYGTEIAPFEVFERDFVSDLFETGLLQAYAVDVSGGSEQVRYFAAARLSDEDGPLGGEELGGTRDRLRRVQTNTSLTFLPRESLQLRVTAAYSSTGLRTFIRNNDVGSPVVAAWASKPELATCDDSSIVPDETYGDQTPVCDGPGNPTGAIGWGTPRELFQNEGTKSGRHLTGSFDATWTGPAGVSARGTIGIDQVDERFEGLFPYGWRVDDVSTLPLHQRGERLLGTRAHRELTFDGQTSWSTSSEVVDLTATLGGQVFLTDETGSAVQGRDFPAPGIVDFGVAAETNASDYVSEKVAVGSFAQAQLGWDGWLFGTLGARYDKTSAFGSEAGPALYPKAGLSALLSELAGWDPPALSGLRVRAAFGQSGLQPGTFDRLTTFEARQAPEGPAFEPGRIGNPELRPERASEIEAGVEAELWNGLLSMDVTYWNRVTRDALVLAPVPAAGGFVEPRLANLGRMDAHGLEARVSSSFSPTRASTVRVFANAAYLSETITDLGGVAPFTASGSYSRHRNTVAEGYAPGTFFGAQLLPTCSAGVERTCWEPGVSVPFDRDGDGVPDSVDDFRAYLASTDAIFPPSLRPMRDDADGDGDLLDHRLGKPTPDWQGSVGADVTWNRVSLSTLFEYRAGDYGVANLTRSFQRAFFGNARETAEVGSILMNPATRSDVSGREAAAMRWAQDLVSLDSYTGMNLVERADMLRWREASLTWRLPEEWSQPLGAQSLSLTLSGRNLAVWTPYSGVDPEANEMSRCGGAGEASNPIQCNFLEATEMFTLPLPRRLSFSLRAVF